MSNSLKIAVLGLAALVLSCVCHAQDKEKKIKRSELPPPVEKTVAVQSAGATVRGFSREEERGKLYYEAELTVHGHSKDVLIASDGTVVEVEEEVAFDSRSPDVKSGLQAKSGSGKIKKVESITKPDKLVAYEAVVVNNGKKSEVQVGPNGKPLDHEE